MTDRYQRQRGLVDVDALRAAHVALIGCGSLGSHVAMGLARMGLGELTIWDADVVSEVNLPSQAFMNTDVGRLKVEALDSALFGIGHTSVTVNDQLFAGGDISGVVVVAVDSLAARKRIWEALRNRAVAFVVDGRMAGDVGRVLTVTPSSLSSRRWYAASLTGEPYEAPCTGRTVWPTVVAVAALMTRAVAMHLSRRPVPEDVTLDLELGLMMGGASCAAPAL